MVSFTGLLVDFAYEIGAQVIVKGVRSASDFEYETSLFRMGDSQDVGIDTFILIAKPELAHISSSAVKQIQEEQGLIHEYVPLNVKQALEQKMSNQYIVAVTGEIGAGKTFVSQQLVKIGSEHGLEVHNIELDQITHQIYQDLPQPKYTEIRDTIAAEFGHQVQNSSGTINRKVLGEIVFNDYAKLQRLNDIMQQPLLVRIRRELHNKQGLIILNAALIVETNMAFLANNHVCLVKTDKQSQLKRLKQRDLNEQQIERRIASQYTFDEKRRFMEEIIDQDGFGQMWVIENVPSKAEKGIKQAYQEMIQHLQI